jgi:hypothetical protein
MCTLKKRFIFLCPTCSNILNVTVSKKHPQLVLIMGLPQKCESAVPKGNSHLVLMRLSHN